MLKSTKNQYYEAILQIRPENKEVVDFIDSQLEKRRDIFISKIIRLKTGIDIYISSQRFARALGKQLKRRFHGELKLSRSLFTKSRETSKMVYRVTVLFRLKQAEQ